jgi:erythritol kinase
MSSVGVDVGTSVVKAVRFSDSGVAEHTASMAMTVSSPRTGWSEQDPQRLWAAVEGVVTQVATPDVEFVAVTAMGDGCWLVDADGAPSRQAILWNDGRAADIVDDWERSGLLREAFSATGSYGNSGLPNALLLWLSVHEPDVVQRSATLLSAGSWIYLQLTGRRALEVSDACNPLLNATTASYDTALLASLGLGWAERLLPPVVSGAEAVSTLLPEVAERLGLGQGTPVVLAPYDVVSSVLGMGAVAQSSGFGILGTTLCVGAVASGPVLDREPAGMALRTGWDDRWLLAYATLAGTGVLEWGHQQLGLGSAADLVALAATSTHTRPPLLLPYLSPAGERAPFRDASARGAFVGLSLEHTQADVARAMVEGLSLAVKDCLVATGQSPSTLRVCGGGSRSPLWCQMLADATRTTVTSAPDDETGARGAMLTAQVALGHRVSVDAAVAHLPQEQTYHARPEAAAHLDESYERLLAARRAGVTHA